MLAAVERKKAEYKMFENGRTVRNKASYRKEAIEAKQAVPIAIVEKFNEI